MGDALNSVHILAELKRKSVISMYRHYQASRRCHRLHRFLAVGQISISVLTASALYYAAEPQFPNALRLLGITLAAVSALTMTVEMFFGFAKAAQRHMALGNTYNQLVSRCEVAAALFSDGHLTRESFTDELKSLHQEYADVVDSAVDAVTTNRDFAIAQSKCDERERFEAQRRRKSMGNEVTAAPPS